MSDDPDQIPTLNWLFKELLWFHDSCGNSDFRMRINSRVQERDMIGNWDSNPNSTCQLYSLSSTATLPRCSSAWFWTDALISNHRECMTLRERNSTPTHDLAKSFWWMADVPLLGDCNLQRKNEFRSPRKRYIGNICFYKLSVKRWWFSPIFQIDIMHVVEYDSRKGHASSILTNCVQSAIIGFHARVSL